MNEVDVSIDDGTGDLIPVGRARFVATRGAPSTLFTYDTSYLARAGAGAIDPQLPLIERTQRILGLPNAFADALPDRWGRSVALLADRDSARARPGEVDPLLLTIPDALRQGALSFMPVGGRARRQVGAAARVRDLPRLIEDALNVQQLDRTGRGDASAVQRIYQAGAASLGGARPKVPVLLDDGQLAIAKLPSITDKHNVIAWEHVALEIAQRAGITTAGHRLTRAGGRSTLLVTRFDRTARGGCIPYISARTLLGGMSTSDANYIFIAEHLGLHGSRAAHDREELFARMVLNVAIGNTDDHLRNHGLLAEPGGWRLAPAFDVTIHPRDSRRALSIGGGTSAADDADSLLWSAWQFPIPEARARALMLQVADAASRWREHADAAGLGGGEQRAMAELFGRRVELVREAARS